ncbi:MAG: cupin domain-containing protein [Labilithrix sp.]|nr:cupin domain-containing protein [Labilithrix sp.]
MSEKPLRLGPDAIHLGGQSAALAVRAFGNDYDGYVAAHCTPDDPGRLVSVAESAEDWPVWEVHPAGDEVVIVLKGRAELIQDFDGTHRTVVLGPNDAVVNPAGIPHTANVIEPFTALYITPCPGTTHLPRKREGG